MRFRVAGREFDIDRGRMVKALDGIEPKPSDGRNKYYVDVDGTRYPIKQSVHAVTRLHYIEFTAQHAYSILKRLGFEVYGPESEKIDVPIEPDKDGSRSRFLVTLIPDEDGYIVAGCPALPGCYSQGRSKTEALANITEAIQAYIESMIEHGEPIPETEVEEVEIAI